AEIANAIGAPLDVFLVRKIGVPGHPELAMGALAEGGIVVRHEHLIREIGVPHALVNQVIARERLELDRRDRQYRSGPNPPHVRDRIVLLVDDGLATGATMEAAILALREQQPAKIVVAAPVGARETCARLSRLADEVECLEMPAQFEAVGVWYEDFAETSDEEVRRLLDGAGHGAPAGKDDRPAAGEVVRRGAIPLTGGADDYDRLVAGVGDAQLVLIGEASHGTHEFYRERALITKRLIVECGFSAVAVEADWPDAYRVNRYVRGAGPDREAVDALGDFKRFPAWMWRNADVLDFVGWLRSHNERHRSSPVGFYGLDLYSLHASMQAVLRYLATVDPDAARRAAARYACFDRFSGDPHAYGYATEIGLAPSCEREAVAQLVELHRQRAEYATRDGRVAPDDYFFAEQNARLVTNAEAYYRSVVQGGVESWNRRDRHMFDTLMALAGFLGPAASPARIVVWAHNSHLGDARATDMGTRGELNLGQLVRERFRNAAVNVGFTTDRGTVTAATGWDGPALRRHVRPSLPGSVERLFHETGIARFLLPLRTDLALASALATPRLERAIGVIYQPETERRSHYFHVRFAEQFDYAIHIDETRAVEPLERTSMWQQGELAETYPSGL
ncbi:MAG TPA: erythromycin esterase family protein, partial [Vicinamibacterales bacterium]|nr:erythromycin esterase family protein [Vicinamibacterales bacterium]